MRFRIIPTIPLTLATCIATVLSRPVWNSPTSSSGTHSGLPVGSDGGSHEVSDGVQDAMHDQLLEAANRGKLWNTMQTAIQHRHYGPSHGSTRMMPLDHSSQDIIDDHLAEAASRGQLWNTMQAAIQHDGRTGFWSEPTTVVPEQQTQAQSMGFGAPSQPFGMGQTQSDVGPQLHPFETSWHTFAHSDRQSASDMPESSSRRPPIWTAPATQQLVTDVPESSSRRSTVSAGVATQQGPANVPESSSGLQHADVVAPQHPSKRLFEAIGPELASASAPDQANMNILESSSARAPYPVPFVPRLSPTHPPASTWYRLALTSPPAQKAQHDIPESSSTPAFAPAQQAQHDIPETSSTRPKLRPGQTFLSARPRSQTTGAAASVDAHEISGDLTPLEVNWIAQMYPRRDQTPYTLAERQWLQRLYNHAIEHGYISNEGQLRRHPRLAQPQQFNPARPQQLHEALPVILSTLGEEHPAYRLVGGLRSSPTHADATANDDQKAAMQAWRRKRNVVSLSRPFIPPNESELTDLQRTISTFKLSDKWGALAPWQYATRTFEGAIEYQGGDVPPMAGEADLASKLSLASLSNQRIMADRTVMKNLGARMIFSQDWHTAYALADGQLLKRAYPNMLEEDRQMLQDGRVAMIRIDKVGNKFVYRLSSVLRPEVIEHVKA